MHGGAAPAVRAAAERRIAERRAAALLESIWDRDAPPVTDAVTALQRFVGQLRQALDVLGARINAEELALNGPIGIAWTRVLREFRMSLVQMEGLGLSQRDVELEREQARLVMAGFMGSARAVGAGPGDT